MFDAITVICRLVIIAEIIYLLWLMKRRRDLTSATWTSKATGIFRFILMLILVIFVTTLQVLASKNEPSIFTYVGPFVFAYGIYQFKKNERLNK